MGYLQPKQTNKQSFDKGKYNMFSIAELIVANEINRVNSKILAIRTNTEDLQPDISIYDKSTNELIGFVEVQGVVNFSDYWNYKYSDFLLYERRLKKEYAKPCIFVAWDIQTDSYLLANIKNVFKACESSKFELKDRIGWNGDKLETAEKIYHLPLNTFRKNSLIDKLDDFFLKETK